MAENTPHLFVEFHMVPVEDKKESLKAGRPIFKDQEFCRIRWAGDNKSELDEPAHQFVDRDPDTNASRNYAQKFPEHYRLFKAGLVQGAIDGTPLSEVPFLTESKRSELRALNILTLESLAGLDGAALSRLGIGGRELKNQAQAWLDKAAGAATEGRLAAELAARDAQIASLQEQMQQLITAKQEQAAPKVDVWEGYSKEDLKAFIVDRSGVTPKGNPSRDTLAGMASEIVAAEKAKAEAEAI